MKSAMSPQKLRKTVFCPMCGATMRKVTSKPNQHRMDEDTGKLLSVTRVFYGCQLEKCQTIVWFDYRQDGKQGRLHKFIAAQKKFGINLGGMALSGKFDDIS